ncbi:hypothetical protein CAI21_17745 [Alkalilimnicola ehrlichii]|uniref:Methyl-accepting chemotaxis protein n=1 Tax=Alkalilimnicola ehrlichii TaxID=351052 RepID=A0A3E0WHP8_9GAMM|nr:methyl-accepting chemotaxis protein [Alkalilimnicola ehrlichii]RFA26173.1 hypothetical protein CAI21_17745 [Alkalilimnicola ehrlichii]RFA31691.1 hypothetical protein CAL65_21640 [Alkalilimnicola ehrlichii]
MLKLITSSIRNKLLLATGSGTALVLGAVVVGAVYIGSTLTGYLGALRADMETIGVHDKLDDSFRKEVIAWQHLLVNSENRAELDANWSALQAQRAEVREYAAQTTERLHNADAQQAMSAFMTRYGRLDALYGQAREVFVRSDYHARSGNQVVGDYHGHLQRYLANVQDFLVADMEQREVVANAQVRNGVVWTVIFVLLGIVVAFFLFLTLVQRGIIAPAKRLVTDLDRLAQGDFTQPVSQMTQDELGQIAISGKQIQTQLGSMISRLRDAVTQVASAAEEMAVVSEQTSQGVRAQQTDINQVATSMNEMAATVQEVARNAASAAAAAREADEAAGNGSRVVGETVTNIQSLAIEVENASQAIRRLEQDSSEIGTVLSVISEVTEQTNLLALNAAIEAARAGEQGRGFAVVADEVRALAQRTQSSTAEINSMIGRLRQGTEETVQAMEVGRQRAQETVGQAEAAGRALASITAAVTTINDMNAQIASASEQQDAVAEEMNKSITTISRVAEQSAEGAQQTTRSSEELARLAEQLQDMVSKFRV